MLCVFIDILRILEYINLTQDNLRIKEYIPTKSIIIIMSNKTTVILTDENVKKIQARKIKLQSNSIKNITFTDALNDLLEN